MRSSGSVARVASLLEVPSLAWLIVFLYAVPAYSIAGEEATLGPGGHTAVRAFSGAATVFAANPQARGLLAVITLVAVFATGLCVIAAWTPAAIARQVLLPFLIVLTALSLLGVATIGVVILPVAVFGWVVFVCAPGTTAESATP